MKKVRIAVIGLSGQSIFLNIDEFHKDGETKQATNVFIEPGGKGYNQAIACKRLGADVFYLSSVGKDEFGKQCEEYMKKEGIETYYVYKDEPTAVATIITNNKGENQVTVFKGASNSLTLEDLEKFKPIIKNCDILLVQNEIPYLVLQEALIYAYNHNIYTILNPAPAVYDINNILPYVNMLIPNKAEAMQIFQQDIDSINHNNMIITLGEEGCIYINEGNKKKYKSYKVKPVDTTGAGDVFCAAIATQIKLSDNINGIIAFANKAASLHIKKPHVLDAIPYLKEI